MLNFKKEAKELPTEELRLSSCPVCSSYVSHIYFMQDAVSKVSSKWFSCSCGVVFQDKMPRNEYDASYWDKYQDVGTKVRDAYEHPIRIYAPLIEELIYNRKVLLVGRQTPHQHEAFEKRGWVATSIDKNEGAEASPNVIVGDFENRFIEDRFGLIWLYNTLECFTDPISALAKATSLLTEDGILFLSSPDTDFINTRGSSGFIHWKPDMHYLMWNIRSISSHLEKLGFNVILARKNYEHRFPSWDEFHIIAQRKFF